MTINKTNVPRNRGLTLVEVIAAALILAMTATTALSVVSSSLMGLRTQSDHLIAQHHAKNLIAEWRLNPKEGALAAGTCPGTANWTWTRSVTMHSGLPDTQLQMVTLTLQKDTDVRYSGVPLFKWTWIERLERPMGQGN